MEVPRLSIDRLWKTVTFRLPIPKSIFNLGNDFVGMMGDYNSYTKLEHKQDVNPFTVPMVDVGKPLFTSIGLVFISDPTWYLGTSLLAYLLQGLQIAQINLKKLPISSTGLEGAFLHLPHRDRAALVCTCLSFARYSSDFELRMKMLYTILCRSQLFPPGASTFFFRSGAELLNALEFYSWRDGRLSYEEYTSFIVPQQPVEPPPKKRKYRRLDGNVKRARQ